MKLDTSKIYPYVVPSGYFDAIGKKNTIVNPLGHGLETALVLDLDGLVQNLTPNDLSSLSLSSSGATQKAIENLELLAMSNLIGKNRFVGPIQKPFILFGGHWAAATCILLPKLRTMGLKNIGSEELCVCIPHREALLMFAKGDMQYRNTMREMIQQKESDGRKPLSFEFFEITEEGIIELKN
jgi:hypothetical protein